MSIVNARLGVLLVLCVMPAWRGKGVGQHIVRYLQPSFVRAVESAVPFFERLGYTGVGAWKQGKRLRTRILIRSTLRGLAGRLQQLEAQTDKGPSLGDVAEAQ